MRRGEKTGINEYSGLNLRVLDRPKIVLLLSCATAVQKNDTLKQYKLSFHGRL